MIDEGRQAAPSGERERDTSGGPIEIVAIAVGSARELLAEFLSLRWARVGRVEFAIPVAMALVAIHFWAQMPALIAGVPFWAWSIGLVVAFLAAREAAARLSTDRTDRALPGRAIVALVAEVGVFWVLYDVVYFGAQRHLYDIDVYLGSAARWIDGGQPYLDHVATAWPAAPAQDYFLYPPPLLPFFGLLSRLPHDLAVGGWQIALVGAGLAAYRLLGMQWRWCVLLLAFPPMFIGIESGNVAPIAFLLFAAGLHAGALLPILTLFKVQSGIAALWLVRERQWRPLLVGGGAVAAVSLATLPLTGIGAWSDWFSGLVYRSESQAGVPSLYGMSFAHYLPAAVYVAIVVALVVLALLVPGRRGLAALGVASIWASPALWPHGFLFALPALLLAESSVLVWMLLGAGAIDVNVWYLFYGAGLIVLAAPRVRQGRLHPVEPKPNGLLEPGRVPASSDGVLEPESVSGLP